MNKRVIKKTIAVVLSLALSFAYVPTSAQAASKNKVNKSVSTKKNTKKKPVGFKISKNAGTYAKKVKVKVKAKKNYKVYFTTGKKFKKSKVIKAGKSKKFTFKKTTTLKLLSVKKSKKVSTKKLNKMAKKSKRLYEYKYVISNETNDNQKKTEKKTDDKNVKDDKKTSETKEDSKDIVNNFKQPYDEKDFEIPEISYEDNAKVDEEASKVTETTPVVAFAEEGTSIKVNGEEVKPEGVTVGVMKGVTRVLITAEGTYAFTGAVKDAVFVVSSDKVNLIFDNFTIDNTKLAQTTKGDNSSVSMFAGTNVKITLVGENNILGNDSFVNEPKAIINQEANEEKSSTLTIVNGGNGVLNVVDSMDVNTEYAGKDPADGIVTKGTLNIKSGNINVTTNGDCLDGTGANGEGGVKISGGNLKLTSNKGSAIKSKNGTVDITGGVVEVLYSGDDAVNAKNYSVNISGGYLKADNVYGDGIQAEEANISGGNVVIKTYFENAGLNYYNEELGEGNYNTLIKKDGFTSSSKSEYINVDTGSHKGIKVGSKDYYYTYKSVKPISKLVAGEEYHKDASGGLNITGGYINLDTTNTGVKYGAEGGMPPMNGQQPPKDGYAASPDEDFEEEQKDSNLTTCGENQVILGCPEDGIKSQNSFNMSGGKLVINASDDGISVANDTLITGDSKVYVNRAYEGVETKNLILGTDGGNDSPYLYTYTYDDGINATEKYKVVYTYEDEKEEKYARDTYSRSGGSFRIYTGEINVYIADDKKHDYKLHVTNGFGVLEDNSDYEGTFSANGDGIDCNGAFYAYGGKVLAYGAVAPGNSPIDCNDDYYIGDGVTLLSVGDMGMPEDPTILKQPVIQFGGNEHGGPGGPPPGFPGDGEGFNPGEGFMPPPPPMDLDRGPSPLGIEVGSYYKIVDSKGNIVFSEIASKALRYVLYSSANIKNGETYTLVCGDTKTEATASTEVKEHEGFGPPPFEGAFPAE